MPTKVLIIDDELSLRRTLRGTLEEEDGWELEDGGFEALSAALGRFRPDMLVLDLIDGQGADGTDVGNLSFEKLRKNWFCPVVVYSAFPEHQSFRHPLVTTVKKGADTELEVRDRLKGFVEHAEMIRSVHQDFDARIREALRDSVDALQAQAGATEREVVIPRAVRRLVAARMDAGETGAAPLRAWERFVVPALEKHLLTADLLRRIDAEWTSEDAFRLVLTPSCDLVPRRDGTTNAGRILVARCQPLVRLAQVELTHGNTLSNSQRDRLRPVLAEGMARSLLPIPKFEGHVPLMAADLKSLELLEWNQVRLEPDDGNAATEGVVYERVASTDSPFREMVVWAYLRVTGRPGLPEIDVDDWLDDISHHFEIGRNHEGD